MSIITSLLILFFIKLRHISPAIQTSLKLIYVIAFIKSFTLDIGTFVYIDRKQNKKKTYYMLLTYTPHIHGHNGSICHETLITIL